MIFDFVILHYQNLEDTLNCIESIKKLNIPKNSNYNIIIVDNKSPNNSGIKIKNKYAKHKNIKIILLDRNYGFSYANNIGYKEAKNDNPNYILVINNDILFENNDFLLKLIENKSNSEIICPNIINANGKKQNPQKQDAMSLKKAYKNMFYQFFIYLISYIPFIRKIVYNIDQKRIDKWFSNYNIDMINVSNIFVPHGSFIIFTKKWIEKEKIAFNSNTFMYMEEDYLYLYILKKKYSIYLDNNLKVRHLEGRSTNTIGTNFKKIRFKSKILCDSLNKYIIYLKKESEVI